MSVSPKVQVEEGTSFQEDERWQLVLRIAGSSHFHKSARHRDFLLYVCEKCINGRQDELHEQQIGVKVFDRPSDYNTSEDNIVRVQARELRKRLESYFASEGKGEPQIITIPKGAYVPVFELRNSLFLEVNPSFLPNGDTALTRELPGTSAIPQIQPLKPISRLIVPLLTGLVILLLAACLWLWQENQAQRQTLRVQLEPPPPSAIWPLLLDTNKQTVIAVSDVALVLLQRFTHKEISLSDYLGRKHMTNLASEELQFISSRQWTTLADVKIIRRMVELNPRHLGRISVLYPWNLQLQDFKAKNIILLGSRWSNPWVDLFDNQRNFHFEYDAQARKSCYVNRSPRAGEETIYCTGGEDGQSDEAYGMLTFLPNVNRSGNVLIIEGTASEGFEAAGDFIENPALFSKFEQRLMAESKDGSLPYFELLLKTNRLETTFKEAIYVTHRILPVR